MTQLSNQFFRLLLKQNKFEKEMRACLNKAENRTKMHFEYLKE